ncbi:MAG: DUF2256 domain-containing protein [Vicingaceae bacterium]
MNKAYLASKTCVVCNRPFSWRKKWEKEWENVKYCSEKCRRHRNIVQSEQKRKS